MRSLLVLLAGSVLGCSWGTMTPDEFKQEFGISASGGKGEVNVLSAYGMSHCLAKLRAAVGETDVHATKVVLVTKTMSLSVRSPINGTHLDSYECRYGEVASPKPIKLSVDEERELDRDAFAFSEVDFDGLPALLDRTLHEVSPEGGAVSSVTIQKLGGRDIEVKVSVSGTRTDGSIEYDGRGGEIGRNGVRKIVNPYADPFKPGDHWKGAYTCFQGRTTLDLQIVTMHGDVIDEAIFAFDSNGKKGSSHTSGKFDPTTATATFLPGAWIEQPGPTWFTVGMTGTAIEHLYAGNLSGSGCTTFSVAK